MIKNDSLTPEFYETVDSLALSEAYYNTAEFFYRKVCRWYSKEFSTELMKVYDLPWDHVISTYYEAMYDSIQRKDLEQLAKERFTPDIVQQEELDNEEFAKKFEQAYLEKQKGNKSESLDKPQSQPEGFSIKFDEDEEEL